LKAQYRCIVLRLPLKRSKLIHQSVVKSHYFIVCLKVDQRAGLLSLLQYLKGMEG